MSDPRVVLHPSESSSIQRALEQIEGIHLVAPEPDEMVAVLQDAPILVTYPWRDEFLTPGLRWVQSISVGVEQFPIDRFRDAGVVLTSAGGIHGPQVAEHALALLLAMTRGIGKAAVQQRDHEWKWPPVTEIGGMTMGVIGLGSIGEAIAQRASALGMRVIGTKRDIRGYQGSAHEVIPAERMDDVFAASDVVVITLPGGDGTRGIVGAPQLAALGEGWLINVGRGSVVDESALIAALTGGSLRGAGIDVFESEPLPHDSPLWDLPNLLVSPHMAGASPRYGSRLAALFRSNLDAFNGTAEWVNRV